MARRTFRCVVACLATRLLFTQRAPAATDATMVPGCVTQQACPSITLLGRLNPTNLVDFILGQGVGGCGAAQALPHVKAQHAATQGCVQQVGAARVEGQRCDGRFFVVRCSACPC